MGQAEIQKSVEATREPSFLLAKPEKRLLTWIAARLPRWILPDDLTALGVLAALGVCAAYQLANDSLDWLWVGERAARPPVARRLARRHARPRAEDRAPDLRLLPRPSRRRDRDRGDRHRARPLAADAALDRDADRRRLPDPLDQRLPRELCLRPLLDRLRLHRADRGAADPDRSQHCASRSAPGSTSSSPTSS